jgi:hypothetical protein
MDARVATTIAIVDGPDTTHGQLMRRIAHFRDFTPSIRWVAPSLSLPEDLAAITEVAAVAIPLGVRGATADDRFTQRLMAAIRNLGDRGIPVLVAAGTRRPNLLARAGIAVSTHDVPGSASTSEACVRAAVAIAHRLARKGNRP